MRYTIDGPIRNVIVCHCAACVEAAGGPWAASAVARPSLAISSGEALEWTKASVSEHGASRGACSSCGTLIFWDAPGRETVSFAAATLSDSTDLETAAHIWVSAREGEADGPTYPAGLPADVVVPWRD